MSEVNKGYLFEEDNLDYEGREQAEREIYNKRLDIIAKIRQIDKTEEGSTKLDIAYGLAVVDELVNNFENNTSYFVEYVEKINFHIENMNNMGEIIDIEE